jgi:hypothetical protein
MISSPGAVGTEGTVIDRGRKLQQHSPGPSRWQMSVAGTPSIVPKPQLAPQMGPSTQSVPDPGSMPTTPGRLSPMPGCRPPRRQPQSQNGGVERLNSEANR